MMEMEKPIRKSKIKKAPRSGSFDDSGSSNGKTRSKKYANSSGSSGAGSLTLVLQHSASTSSNPNAIEVGMVLSFLFLVIYTFGFYETIQHLPDSSAAVTTPDFAHHLGENFNVAVNEWGSMRNRTAANVALQSSGVSSGIHNGAAVGADLRDLQGRQEPPKHEQQQLRGGLGEGAAPIHGNNDPEIPEAHWPVSLRNEPENFESLIHPGDRQTVMNVPKFWSQPIHNNQLMTYETAMKIGTCMTPDAVNFPQHPFQRGDACPVHDRTIFVAIASYRDFQCRYTVESAFLRAANPERIRVAIVDQIVDGEDALCNAPIFPCKDKPEQALCKYKDRVDVYEMEADLSIGPVFARHLGHRMYRGEYYSTQSDAHVTFTQNWDADIISQMESTKDEMAVLSTYLTDVQGSISPDGHSLRHTRPIMCNTYYEGGPQGKHLRHGSQPEREPTIKDQPMLQPWWAAGYSFSRGHFLVNVPYDPWQPMIFQGEEMSIGIRGFTIGYDYYAPERSVCFHHYAVGANAKVRNKVHHFWENDRKYAGTGKQAMARLLGIVRMNPEVSPGDWDHRDEAQYGLGGVRTPEKFYETFGIDVVKKTTEGHLCMFVDNGTGRMHRLFMKELRPDKMGVDYSKIDFHFKDPMPGAKRENSEEE